MFCFVGHGETFVNLDRANQPPQQIWKSERLISRRNTLKATESFIVYLHYIFSFFPSLFEFDTGDEREKERKWKLRVNLRTANTSETP